MAAAFAAVATAVEIYFWVQNGLDILLVPFLLQGSRRLARMH